MLSAIRRTPQHVNRHVTRPLNCSFHRNLITLAIESSCDDTCVAILEKRCVSAGKQREGINSSSEAGSDTILRFNEKITAKNTGLGGIHPVEALESHHRTLSGLVNRSIAFLPKATAAHEQATSSHILTSDGQLRQKPDFVSVTRGPGMRSNLACGINTAKGLSVAWQVPLVGVHHMQAHALTPRLVNASKDMPKQSDKPSNSTRDLKEKTPSFPFLTLLVSGGHTMLLSSSSLTSHKILASTRDIAIGDALDKAGRTILPDHIKANATDTAYGKYLSRYAFPDIASFKSYPIPTTRQAELAKPKNKFGWQVQTALASTRDMAFSFSAISSQVERFMRESTAASSDGQVSDEERMLLARSALGSAFEHLGSRTVIALEHLQTQARGSHDIRTLVVSGGVAANDFLRYFLRALLDVRGFAHVELVFPPVELCTDNAAMIAWAGMEMFEAGYRSDLSITAKRKWSLDPDSEDGGILGADGWIKDEVGMEKGKL